MDVLLSIKPEFVKEIFSFNKLYVYRKSIFKRPVERVYIYSSLPVQLVVGHFRFNTVLSDSVDEIWRLTRLHSGISEEYYYKYFHGHERAFAIPICHLIEYPNPLPLSAFRIKYAPQSFCYIPEFSFFDI